MRASALLMGGGCLRHLGEAATLRASCCRTPEIEPASVSIGETQIAIDLSQAPSLGAVHGAANVTDQARKLELIVVRTAKNRYCALSRRCTHAGSQVFYVKSRRILQCGSFNHAAFGLDGSLLRGPGSGPLKSYPVSLSNGKLVIAL
jgi:nitrite reductase/ring-hydroxylating ferredoxin subunit